MSLHIFVRLFEVEKPVEGERDIESNSSKLKVSPWGKSLLVRCWLPSPLSPSFPQKKHSYLNVSNGIEADINQWMVIDSEKKEINEKLFKERMKRTDTKIKHILRSIRKETLILKLLFSKLNK